MTFTIPMKESKPRVLPAEGTHIARCYSVVDLGTHEESYQGETYNARKVRLTFELPYETAEFNGEVKPLVCSTELNITYGLSPKSNARKFIQSMIGSLLSDDEARAFDLNSLAGVACQVSLVKKTSQKGADYVKVSGVSGLAKGMSCPEQVNPSFILNFNDDWNEEKFDTLPQFLKEAMKATPEWHAITGTPF